MTARENILKRIRDRQGKPALPGPEELEAVQSYIRLHGESPRPRLEGDQVEHFRERALSLSTTLDEVDGPEEVAQAVAAYLARNALPLSAVCWPEFAEFDWRSAGLDVAARAARDGDLVGITGAYCAIAETGTLMLASGPRTPATVSLLPETHIAVVQAARIVPGMENAWQLLRAEHGGMPRAVNFVSGPSRTADIEQTVSLKTHGPYRVHVILVGRRR